MTTLVADSGHTDVPPSRRAVGRGPRLAAAGVVVVLVAAVVLRFWARSPLWLDESQSVAIARLPLFRGHGTTLWTGLRQDGSPPLYYLLLHGWIGLFGTSDGAVRALSGVLSLLSFPLLWRLARHLGSRRAATASVLFFAVSPFAVRFATETRMYSLLVLLALIGGLALLRIIEKGPAPGAVVSLAVTSAALALTHYWSFYLLVTVGMGLLVASVHAGTAVRRRCRWALESLLSGGILFIPWLPNFAYQLKHTGTPWGRPAGLSAVVHAFGEWAGGDSAAGRLLLLVLGALLIFAVFGSAVDGRHVVLDLRGHDPGRFLLGITLSTLVLAVVVGHLVGTAWADRYTATAFVPFLIVAGLGVQALASAKVATGFVAVACVLGLVASVPDIYTDRTDAGTVAALVNARAKPGDILLTCPDQLGPALSRVVRPGIPVLGIPTLQPAGRVDWVDYAHRQKVADPAAMAAAAVARAGPTGTIFLAINSSYRTYETLCPAMGAALATLRPDAHVVKNDTNDAFEHAGLNIYLPTKPAAGG
ncbi:MAG TPA: glycosyltransferase family 39 protein [Mycobacteriales bacterium]